MSDVELDYEYLTQNALKRVVYEVLSITAELKKTPGDHHFYIEFATQAPGVVIPDHLLETYPEAMTIVIQHQFDNLEVDEEKFAITLWFKGKPARLTVPFEAVTNFADPSVSFGLRFPAAAPAQGRAVEQAQSAEEPAAGGQPGAEVVSLDSFRKK